MLDLLLSQLSNYYNYSVSDNILHLQRKDWLQSSFLPQQVSLPYKIDFAFILANLLASARGFCRV